MVLPIKLYMTEDSFLIFRIAIPTILWFRTGFRPDHIIAKDRFFSLRIVCMTGEEVSCLHAYCFSFTFRIRSNKIMRVLKPGTKRFLFATHKGWGQVFNTAII